MLLTPETDARYYQFRSPPKCAAVGVPQRDITLVSGASSREKVFDISLAETELHRRLDS